MINSKIIIVNLAKRFDNQIFYSALRHAKHKEKIIHFIDTSI